MLTHQQNCNYQYPCHLIGCRSHIWSLSWLYAEQDAKPRKGTHGVLNRIFDQQLQQPCRNDHDATTTTSLCLKTIKETMLAQAMSRTKEMTSMQQGRYEGQQWCRCHWQRQQAEKKCDGNVNEMQSY